MTCQDYANLVSSKFFINQKENKFQVYKITNNDI